MTSKTPAGQLPAILANPSTGVVNSKLVKQHGGTASVGADKNDHAEQWLNSSASVGAAAARTRCRPTARPRRSRSSATRSTGARRSRRSTRSSSATWSLRPADQRAARRARGRDRPRVRPGAVAQVELARPCLAAAVDVGVLALREQQPAGLAVTSNKQFQNAIRFGSTTSRSSAWPARGVPDAGAGPVDVRRALPPRKRSSRTLRRRSRRSQASARRARTSRSSIQRPDDQRRPVRDARAEGAVEPAGIGST